MSAQVCLMSNRWIEMALFNNFCCDLVVTMETARKRKKKNCAFEMPLNWKQIGKNDIIMCSIMLIKCFK